MTAIDPRTFDAAARLLAAVAAESRRCNNTETGHAAWIVGRGGGAVPALANPTAHRLAQIAGAFGAGRNDEALELLEAAVVDEESGATYVFPLIHACYLAGESVPDRIVTLTQRYPRQASQGLSGELLVGTTRPDDLLALYARRTDDRAFRVVGELVLAHRDRGTPHAGAEAHWRAIEVAWPAGSYQAPELLALQTRMSARVSLEAAIEKLIRGPVSYQWPATWTGVLAVLARLVAVDAARAVSLVDGTDDPSLPPPEPYEMVQWIRALAWHFRLPPQVEPMVEACLRADLGAEHALVLVNSLVAARRPDLLDRAIAQVGVHEPAVWATTLAGETKRLREAGYTADAELVRERMVRVAPSELDLFDVRSAPELPRAHAWAHGAALP